MTASGLAALPSPHPSPDVARGDQPRPSRGGTATVPRRPRRQWGAERARPPLPAVEPPARPTATWFGGLLMTVTVTAWLVYLLQTVVSGYIDHGLQDSRFLRQTAFYVVLMTALIFSSLMYLLARQGALYRSRTHVRAPRAEIDAFMTDHRPSLTVLVPSYREEPEVVWSTLLSAALQEYPGLRVVLLLDDPPDPTDEDGRRGLHACRALPRDLMALLEEPAERCETYALVVEGRATDLGAATAEEITVCAEHHEWAADWLSLRQMEHVRRSHADDFVADEVLGRLAEDFRTTASALRAAAEEGASVPNERLAQLARRLAWTFRATVSVFERKNYANLPHDANKAMNLNAYLALMGSTVRAEDTRIGRVLRRTDAPDAVEIPDSDYVLTLDADSVLLREYCLRLVHHMEQPGNERIAVIQTPYSAFRGAGTRLERIAGATTDIQHIVHQGLTHFDATFWVGANAVIRKRALDDIVEVSYVGCDSRTRCSGSRTRPRSPGRASGSSCCSSSRSTASCSAPCSSRPRPRTSSPWPRTSTVWGTSGATSSASTRSTWSSSP